MKQSRSSYSSLPLSTDTDFAGMTFQHPRFTAVEAAFSGGSHPRLDKEVDETVIEYMDPSQKQRLEKALDADFYVFPISPGEYRVISPEGERGDDTVYDIDIRYTEFTTCSCGDFFYRCDLGGDERCKHLWRTHLLIRIGVLPDSGIDPYDWLLDELIQDIRLLEALVSEYSTDVVQATLDEMRDLLSTVESCDRDTVDMVSLCRRRSTILSTSRSDARSDVPEPSTN